jgi:hypothetical protein
VLAGAGEKRYAVTARLRARVHCDGLGLLFAIKRVDYSSNRKGEREYLNKALAKDMMRKLNSFVESTIEIPRVRHGNKQTVETLINEETMLFAKYLRDEKPNWHPRIVGSAR